GASVAALMDAGADEKIPVITADGDGRRQLNRSEMVAVLEEAVDEFIRKLCVWLEENSKAGMPGAPIDLSKQLPAGVVCIGGGALLTNLADKLAKRLTVSARVGKPLYLRAAPDICAQLNTPEACCLHGLLACAAQTRAAEVPAQPKGVLSRWWTSLKRLAEEF
ncbi:MAG TPA: hypothetical protein VL860_11165, partial [Planctomycetota bacterium]|nr:hypothetical protein [Planctomycetota bacterium]